ncbi:hypothetical protein B0H16DRAFT_1837364 [Mycena metata]|uniref:Uncharacterized protein n=1 Tax=Mycena metata TaxID=1033252 RepID=A0AAD7J0V5_9AGAR|nr:hypothetical protein B0H16DRAFT_1837364 [Mycena metata]
MDALRSSSRSSSALGGTIETPRRMSSSACNHFLNSFILTAHFSEEETGSCCGFGDGASPLPLSFLASTLLVHLPSSTTYTFTSPHPPQFLALPPHADPRRPPPSTLPARRLSTCSFATFSRAPYTQRSREFKTTRTAHADASFAFGWEDDPALNRGTAQEGEVAFWRYGERAAIGSVASAMLRCIRASCAVRRRGMLRACARITHHIIGARDAYTVWRTRAFVLPAERRILSDAAWGWVRGGDTPNPFSPRGVCVWAQARLSECHPPSSSPPAAACGVVGVLQVHRIPLLRRRNDSHVARVLSSVSRGVRASHCFCLSPPSSPLLSHPSPPSLLSFSFY